MADRFVDAAGFLAGGAGDLSQFLPGELRLVAARDVAALYQVVRR